MNFVFFCLDFAPLEYIPTIPPQYTYFIDNCFVLFKVKSARVFSSPIFSNETIMYVERGDIVRISSSGAKSRQKHEIHPIETTYVTQNWST